ncbi:hypothetical protein ACADC178_1644 [Lactobacillus delbrueckii subsp. lactis]|nr:hypothetical protein ACADC178_1644 [Lactobacillus delbrueckii subsp. lactis]
MPFYLLFYLRKKGMNAREITTCNFPFLKKLAKGLEIWAE